MCREELWRDLYGLKPGDDDCVETTEIKACDPEGACVSDTGDLCDGAYEPCVLVNYAVSGRTEGCTVCAPDDFDCFETDEIKACDPEGQCVSDTGDLCPNADTLCGRINDGQDLVSALEWSGGCGDLTLYATKPDRTIELNLYIAGVCEEAHDGSALLSRTCDLPSDAVSLGSTLGAFVDEFTCNDAILNDPVINETLVPLSGRLELEVTPDGEANAWMFPSMVSATLRDAVFVDGTGCGFTLNFDWTDVYAGWFQALSAGVEGVRFIAAASTRTEIRRDRCLTRNSNQLTAGLTAIGFEVGHANLGQDFFVEESVST